MYTCKLRHGSPLEGMTIGFLKDITKQQRRHISGRQIAYPSYKFKMANFKGKNKHDTNLRFAMRQFLGPKNFKGEYIYNKYYSVPQNHEPKYIKPSVEGGEALVDVITGERLSLNPNGSLTTAENTYKPKKSRDHQPFPDNKYCFTNLALDEETRRSIHHMITVEGMTAQQVSLKFNLKIPRIEAVVRLVDIEDNLELHSRTSSQLNRMSETMYKMFPIFEPHNKENLSEIPIPVKALSSHILTIAESQPFGPIEASKVLGLEPASETLKKLGELGEHSANHDTQKQQKKNRVIYGEVLEHDRFKYKFVNMPVGQVGFRYGRPLRDNKKDRKIGFDKLGKMIYL